MNTQNSLPSILQQIAKIQTMERGKLSVIKESSAGPFYKIQAREQGKNLTRYVPREQVGAVQEAIEGYQRFKSLTEQYAQQIIERTRQAIAAGSKKKSPAPDLLLAQDEEIQQLMTRFLASDPGQLALQELDLEVLLRAAVFKSTNQLMGYLFQKLADRVDAAYQPKPGFVRKGPAALTVDCIFGSFQIQRDYYHHEGKGLGHYPFDAALGLEGGKTPALARLVCLEGADQDSYQQAEEHLKETGGIHISARQIQRLVQQVGAAAQTWQEREALKPLPGSKPVPVFYVSGDATGVPMRKEELEGRKGKQPDGGAKTRSAYLGCVFTQHKTDEKGHPVRDYESTTYVSNMGPLEEFGPLLRQEAIRRGMGQAKKVVFLVDGAEGLENMGHLNFKDAIQIVDFYHGADHAGDVVAALLGSKEHPEYKARRSRWVRRLLGNGVKNLIEETRQECAGKPQAQQVYEELGYFVHNIERMQYRTFRRQGLFIGSGVVEAGCKTVIGSRCKQSGMFWGTPGAENILALRCIHASRRRDQFWKERLNARAAGNDCLSLVA